MNSNSNHSAKVSKLFYDFEKDLLSQTVRTPDQYQIEPLPQSDPFSNPVLMPYYQLRAIKRTIETGGFLTEDVFVPSAIWSQSGVKFSGLSIKTNAFQNIAVLISEQIATLQLDETGMRADSMSLAVNAFKVTRENLRAIQNQLSKPFSYIKEASDKTLGADSPNTKKSQVSKWAGLISSFSKNVMKVSLYIILLIYYL